MGCEADSPIRLALMLSLALAVAGAASAAPIGQRPDLDRLAGVYKHRAAPGLGRKPAQAGEDILEIVKVSDRSAYLRIHTEDGDHICGWHGVADLAPDALVYRLVEDDGSPCALKVRSTRDGVVLDDAGGHCSRWNCGAGADLGTGDRVNFRFSEQRPIRYLPRILQSREYAEALKEHDPRR